MGNRPVCRLPDDLGIRELVELVATRRREFGDDGALRSRLEPVQAVGVHVDEPLEPERAELRQPEVGDLDRRTLLVAERDPARLELPDW